MERGRPPRSLWRLPPALRIPRNFLSLLHMLCSRKPMHKETLVFLKDSGNWSSFPPLLPPDGSGCQAYRIRVEVLCTVPVGFLRSICAS